MCMAHYRLTERRKVSALRNLHSKIQQEREEADTIQIGMNEYSHSSKVTKLQRSHSLVQLNLEAEIVAYITLILY